MFSGRHDEDDMWRWLLKRFKQGIKCFWREHVCFIYNIDFIGAGSRGEFNVFTKVSNRINAAIGGSIHLEYVKGSTVRDVIAKFTLVAGFSGGGGVKFRFLKPVGTVDGFGKNTCDRCLSCTARSPKEICMPDALGQNLVFQRRCNVLLSNNITEVLGAPFLGEYLVRHFFYLLNLVTAPLYFANQGYECRMAFKSTVFMS